MLQHVVHAHPASTNPVVGTMLQHVLHAHPASTMLSPLQPLFGSARIIYLAKVPLLAPRWKVLSQPAICNAVTKYPLQPSLGSQITVVGIDAPTCSPCTSCLYKSSCMNDATTRSTCTSCLYKNSSLFTTKLRRRSPLRCPSPAPPRLGLHTPLLPGRRRCHGVSPVHRAIARGMPQSKHD